MEAMEDREEILGPLITIDDIDELYYLRQYDLWKYFNDNPI